MDPMEAVGSSFSEKAVSYLTLSYWTHNLMESRMVRKLNPPRNYPIPECACCDAKDERIRELEAALREIGEEIAAHGCDGQFEEVCIHAERSPEDWCRYCRMGASITSILP